MNVTKLLEKLSHWHRNREAINYLLSRSDRELGDIGLVRGNVVRAVTGDAHSVAR